MVRKVFHNFQFRYSLSKPDICYLFLHFNLFWTFTVVVSGHHAFGYHIIGTNLVTAKFENLLAMTDLSVCLT